MHSLMRGNWKPWIDSPGAFVPTGTPGRLVFWFLGLVNSLRQPTSPVEHWVSGLRIWVRCSFVSKMPCLALLSAIWLPFFLLSSHFYLLVLCLLCFCSASFWVIRKFCALNDVMGGIVCLYFLHERPPSLSSSCAHPHGSHAQLLPSVTLLTTPDGDSLFLSMIFCCWLPWASPAPNAGCFWYQEALVLLLFHEPAQFIS